MPRNPRRKQALLALVELLAPSAKRVASEVAFAYDEPARYLERHAKRLDDRNIDGPRDGLPWIALIDGLIEAGYVASMDWKTDFENVISKIGRLRSLPKSRSRFAWAKREVGIDARSTLELLELTGRRLSEDEDLILADLDVGGDEYDLVVIPRDRVPRFVALAKRARYGSVELLLGKKLKKLERARLAQQKKEQRDRDRDPSRQRQFIDGKGRLWMIWGDSWRADNRRYHGVATVARKLGVETVYRPPMHEQKIFTDAKRAKLAREREITRRLRQGYVEVTSEEMVLADKAAKRKSRRLR